MTVEIDWANLFRREQALRDSISEWQAAASPTALDLLAKEKRLTELQKSLEDLEGEYTAAVALATGRQVKQVTQAKGASIESVKPVSRQLSQESIIIKSIMDLGYDPGALPPREIGKKWVKSEVRAILLSEKGPMSPGVFSKAWQRLREHGAICEQKVENS